MWQRKLAVLAYLAVGFAILGACFAFLWLWGESMPDDPGQLMAQQIPSMWTIFGGFGIVAFFLFGYRAWSLSLQYHFFLAQAGQRKYLPPKLLMKTLFGVGYSYTIGVVTGFVTMPILLVALAKYAGMNSMMALMMLMQDWLFLAGIFILWAVATSILYIRLSLVFPAIAYGKNAGLLNTWEISKGHGLRLFISGLFFLAFTALALPLAYAAQTVEGSASLLFIVAAGGIVVLSEVLWNVLFAVWYKELLLRGIRLKRRARDTVEV